MGKGYVPTLHFSLFTADGIGTPARPAEKSKQKHWGGRVCLPQSLESEIFEIGDICTITEPDVFYRNLQGKLIEFMPFEQEWRVKLTGRLNIVRVAEQFLKRVRKRCEKLAVAKARKTKTSNKMNRFGRLQENPFCDTAQKKNSHQQGLCSRCGCSGYFFQGRLFDEFMDKKCFCDACVEDGCSI